MNQQLFNHLVYWGLKNFHLRVLETTEETASRIQSTRYFFSTLLMAATKVQSTQEQINHILMELEIEKLSHQYRAIENKETFLELQEHYTQLLVEKINQMTETQFSFTLEAHEVMTFFDFLILTHKIELGIGLLSGTVTGLAILTGHSGWVGVSALPGAGVLGWIGYTYYQWQILQQIPLTFSKKYLVNPCRQYKIWLGQDVDEDLPLQYKSQLIDLRQKEGALLSLVYDSNKMALRVHQRLLDFCGMHQIAAVDIREEVFPKCQSQQERELIKIYQLEMDCASQGGSYFVAKQVLKWLKPIYELGMYVDFDVTLSLHKLNSQYAFKQPIIFDIKQLLTEDEGQVQIHSNIGMVTHTQDAKPFIEKIQNNIIKSYALQNQELYCYAYEVIKSFKRFEESISFQDALELNILEQLKGKRNHLEIRQGIQNFYKQLLEEQRSVQKEACLVEDIEISAVLDKVVDNCCGGEQILKTLEAHLLEEDKTRKQSSSMMAWGVEYYQLKPSIIKTNPEDRKYEQRTVREQEDNDEEKTERSAYLIQSFFKDKLRKQNKLIKTTSEELGWEIISQNQYKLV